jgi:hypothetical protein
MRFDKLGNVSLQNLVTHAKSAAGVERFFFKIKAVGAVKVAG